MQKVQQAEEGIPLLRLRPHGEALGHVNEVVQADGGTGWFKVEKRVGLGGGGPGIVAKIRKGEAQTGMDSVKTSRDRWYECASKERKGDRGEAGRVESSPLGGLLPRLLPGTRGGQLVPVTPISAKSE